MMHIYFVVFGVVQSSLYYSRASGFSSEAVSFLALSRHLWLHIFFSSLALAKYVSAPNLRLTHSANVNVKNIIK